MTTRLEREEDAKQRHAHTKWVNTIVAATMNVADKDCIIIAPTHIPAFISLLSLSRATVRSCAQCFHVGFLPENKWWSHWKKKEKKASVEYSSWENEISSCFAQTTDLSLWRGSTEVSRCGLCQGTFPGLQIGLQL